MPTVAPTGFRREREVAYLQLRRVRRFQGRLGVFLIVNAAVWALWWTVGGAGYPWPAWLTGAWGLGLAIDAWEIYVRRPITARDVEREIRRLHSLR